MKWVPVSGGIGAALFAGWFLWAHTPFEPLPSGSRADRIVVEKSGRILRLYDGGKELRTYTISLGWHPRGHKVMEGDKKTPEGRYQVTEHKKDSAYHRALRLSYPESKDRAEAARLGVSPGGDIMIHGIRNGMGWVGKTHRWLDWTAGCVAVTNAEMDEIFAVVQPGAVVDIRP